MRTRIVSKTTASGNMELGVIDPDIDCERWVLPIFRRTRLKIASLPLPRGCLAGETRALAAFRIADKVIVCGSP